MSHTTAYSVLLATLIVSYLIRWQRRLKDLPPGPTRLPVIGSLLSLSHKLESGFFLEIGKQHDSDIIHFDAAGQHIIVLNSYDDARELFEKRSGIYSSRPRFTMLADISGFGFQFALWPYADKWRAARRAFTQYFTRPEIHQPRETRYSQRLLQQLLENPANWHSYIQLLTTSTALDMTYGVRIQSAEDPLVKVVEEGARLSGDVADGAYLVDLIPGLQHIPAWFPGAAFQRTGVILRRSAAQVLDAPFQACLEMMTRGTHEPSYLSSSLEDIENAGGSEEETALAKQVAGQVFLAGSDTSKAALLNFIVAMLTHPEIQRAVQNELDSVLHDRLPQHQDLQDLPLLSAVILETYRTWPVLPIGLPHTSTMEDIYSGYRIPSGSTIIANLGAFLHNEAEYPEPRKFKPERFLQSGQLNPEVRNPMDILFGFGRRICPGRHIAHSTVMLTAASILSTFNIVKQKDVNGQSIDPLIKYHYAFINQPMNFPCDFKPRSAQAEQLIQSLTDEI